MGPIEIGIGLAAVVAGCVLLVREIRTPDTPSVSFYSASDTAGGYFDPPGVLQTYSPDPAKMVQDVLGWPCVNHSINGMQLRELLAGGPVQMAIPGIGQDGVVIPSFADQLAGDQSTVIVMGCGMVDALVTDTTLEQYVLMVEQAVRTVLQAGKLPVLRGFHRIHPGPVLTVERLAKAETFNAALQSFAATRGVPFIDLANGVPFNGSDDMCADGVHPTEDYHRRIAACIAAALKKLND